MTMAKLTKALRKIATCFETSSWRGSRMPEEKAVLSTSPGGTELTLAAGVVEHGRVC